MGKIAKPKPASQKNIREKKDPPPKKPENFDKIISRAREFTKVHIGAEQVADWKKDGWSHNMIRRMIGRMQAEMGKERRLRDGVPTRRGKRK